MTLRDYLIERYREPAIKVAVTLRLAAVAAEQAAAKLYQKVSQP